MIWLACADSWAISKNLTHYFQTQKEHEAVRIILQGFLYINKAYNPKSFEQN